MIYYQGRWWDEWPMRMLRSEWELSRKPPAEGLRPYHPNDYDGAVALLQRLVHTPDKEAARAVLRRWWRQIDREVYGYQVDGVLVGLLTLAADTEKPHMLDSAIDDRFQAAVQNAVVELVKR
jgi:hypothetical protein